MPLASRILRFVAAFLWTVALSNCGFEGFNVYNPRPVEVPAGVSPSPTPGTSGSGNPSPSPLPSPVPSSAPSPTPSGSSYEFVIGNSPDVARQASLLLVLDNSGSMIEELNAVYDKIAVLTDGLKREKIDFDMRVTTTDDQLIGQLMRSHLNETVLTAKTPSIEIKLREMLNDIPFPSFNGEETGIRNALEALKRFEPSPRTNVVFFSDENDASIDSVANYAAGFRAIEASKSVQLSFHSVVFSNASTCPIEVDESMGLRYLELVNAFSNRGSKAYDICRMDITFAELANQVSKQSGCFTLPANVKAPYEVYRNNSRLISSDYQWSDVKHQLCLSPAIKVTAGDRMKLLFR